MINKTDKKLSELTILVEKLINREVAVVAPVAPVLPIAPVAPVLPVNTGDHDFLLTFSSEVKVRLDNINDTLIKLSNGTASQIAALEMKTEKNTNDITKIMTFGTALIIFVGIIEFVINKFL